MARDLIIEERQPEEEVQTAIPGSNIPGVASTGSTTSHSKASANIGKKSTIITSSEIDRLLQDWTINGQNDLSIDTSLAERIREYLANQEEINPLKVRLAEQLYKPYAYRLPLLFFRYYKDFNIYLNGSEFINTSFFVRHGKYCLVHISILKYILSSLGNPYAPYMSDANSLHIDLVAYVLANGGTLDFREKAVYITL